MGSHCILSQSEKRGSHKSKGILRTCLRQEIVQLHQEKKGRGGETRRVEEDAYLDASVGGVMQIAVGDACLPLCATDN